MRVLMLLVMFTIITVVLWWLVGTVVVSKSVNVSPKLVELATPLRGKIDVEFLHEEFGDSLRSL